MDKKVLVIAAIFILAAGLVYAVADDLVGIVGGDGGAEAIQPGAPNISYFDYISVSNDANVSKTTQTKTLKVLQDAIMSRDLFVNRTLQAMTLKVLQDATVNRTLLISGNASEGIRVPKGTALHNGNLIVGGDIVLRYGNALLAGTWLGDNRTWSNAKILETTYNANTGTIVNLYAPGVSEAHRYPKITFVSNGNVGIGFVNVSNTAPDAKLDVNGSVRLNGQLTSATGDVIIKLGR